MLTNTPGWIIIKRLSSNMYRRVHQKVSLIQRFHYTALYIHAPIACTCNYCHINLGSPLIMHMLFSRVKLSTPNEQDTSLSLPPPSSPHPPTPPPTTDSIAHHIHTTLTAISSGLTSSYPRGVQDVFTVDGRGRTVFQSMWDMYSSQVTSLEKNIADYLRVSVNLLSI